MAVSFIGGGNQSKPPTFRKFMTNIITQSCIERTSIERYQDISVLNI
jgi:hypothetical protein